TDPTAAATAWAGGRCAARRSDGARHASTANVASGAGGDTCSDHGGARVARAARGVLVGRFDGPGAGAESAESAGDNGRSHGLNRKRRPTPASGSTLFAHSACVRN